MFVLIIQRFIWPCAPLRELQRTAHVLAFLLDLMLLPAFRARQQVFDHVQTLLELAPPFARAMKFATIPAAVDVAKLANP